jgi:hypothetical protein
MKLRKKKMNASDCDTQNITLVSWGWINQSEVPEVKGEATPINAIPKAPSKPKFDLFQPVRRWLDRINVQNAEFAHMICKRIPSQCPFERDIKLFNRTLFHIPPLCKLNPVYDEVVALRFRALCYLADECGEDVTPYC